MVLTPAEAAQLSAGVHDKTQLSGPVAGLTVSDTGSGMTREVQAHVFEPFFTTKGAGRSTGLGLSTVYGIVRQYGGAISLHSLPGIGTTFSIFLPLLNMPAVAPSGAGAQPGPAATLKGTVLLVEDDPLSRGILNRTLHGMGLVVLETENAHLALDRAQASRKRVDLMVCDLFLAGTDGRKFADNLKRIHPKMNVVFFSGYPASHLRIAGHLRSGEFLITRPFSAQAVEPVIRAALAGNP
jgi:two-component system, cell cycle sensor histidine kinase and response regulator CckA